jgi:2-methylisocitrate lyase-like PEP mutase family enzyme
LSLEQLAAHAATIAAAVRIPVIADAESFNNAVPAFEAAGVSAIHIEDHTGAGKHTGEPQTLHPVELAAERIRAAVAARTNPDFLIVARSDAFWVHGDLEDCIARLQRYAEAGADMVFPTMVGPRELAEVRKQISRPITVVDMPGKSLAEHAGAAIVLYYAFSVATQFNALQRALADGKLAADTQPLEDFLGYKDASGRKQ